jgi:hypothetical protein
MLKRNTHAIAIFLISLTSYVYFFPRWADVSQNSRLNMVRAIVDDGTFRIDKYVGNTVDYAKIGDAYYSDKAPGASFLAVPVYALVKFGLSLPIIEPLTNQLENSDAFKSTLRENGSGVGEDKVRVALSLIVISFFVGALPTAALCVLIFLFAQKLTGNAIVSVIGALSYGLLSPAFAYANVFYGHNISAFLLFAAFFVLFNLQSTDEQVKASSLLLAGFLLGYSVLTEYPTLLIAAILFVYALYTLWRKNETTKIFWLMLSAAICAGVLLLYNKTLFGSPFDLGYNHSELWTKQHSSGFVSLTFPRLDALFGIFFGVFRGLFFYSPITLLAVAGFWFWFRSKKFRAELWATITSLFSFALFNASSVMWWGGWGIGPRYLLPALPFAGLAIAFALHSSRAMTRIALPLALWSLVVTWSVTLAEQSFPPDNIFNPLFEYAVPNWANGNIARNLGTLFGFKGAFSLIPLGFGLIVLSLAWRKFNRDDSPSLPTKSQNTIESHRNLTWIQH